MEPCRRILLIEKPVSPIYLWREGGREGGREVRSAEVRCTIVSELPHQNEHYIPHTITISPHSLMQSVQYQNWQYQTPTPLSALECLLTKISSS